MYYIFFSDKAFSSGFVQSLCFFSSILHLKILAVELCVAPLVYPSNYLPVFFNTITCTTCDCVEKDGQVPALWGALHEVYSTTTKIAQNKTCSVPIFFMSKNQFIIIV